MPLKSVFTLLLCLTMLLQNAMALGLAAVSMQKAQQYTTQYNKGASAQNPERYDDIELICTGKTMRWISLSATELAGEFVFVSVDVDKVPAEHIDCTNSLLSDLPHGISITYASSDLIAYVRYTHLVTTLAQRPYTAYAFAAPLSRAPPHS